MEAIPRLVGTPSNAAIGQRISDESVTLVRDNGKLLPLTPWGLNRAVLHPSLKSPRRNLVVIILCDNLRAEDGRVLEREIQARRPDANVIYVDAHVAAERSNEVVNTVDQARVVAVAVYIVPSAARSMQLGRISKHPASLPDSTAALLNGILRRAADKSVVLAMGSPYLTDDFPAIQNYICTFSNASVSEISAAKALFGEIPIHGHMPVNLLNAHVQAPAAARSAQLARAKSIQ